MTLFGWDASHYDGTLTPSILARARSEGIVFFTHKLGEGLQDTEGTHDDTALASARSAGIEFVGGYVIPRSLDPAAQVDYWWRLLNSGEPWWKDFPGWFNQVDLERWSYDNVSAATGIDCAKRWRDRTGRQTILYASHSQYGDQLAGWDGPLWNADYVSAPAAGFAAMYPGDSWRPLHKGWYGGWSAYSGREPVILQYTSSATIAGLTTCDANAFRGTVEEFRALINGGDMDPADVWNFDGIPAPPIEPDPKGNPTWTPASYLAYCLAPLPGKVDALAARLDKLAAAPAGQPTQDQVNTAVLAAMKDPAVQAGIGAAIAAHVRVV